MCLSGIIFADYLAEVEILLPESGFVTLGFSMAASLGDSREGILSGNLTGLIFLAGVTKVEKPEASVVGVAVTPGGVVVGITLLIGVSKGRGATRVGLVKGMGASRRGVPEDAGATKTGLAEGAAEVVLGMTLAGTPWGAIWEGDGGIT